MIGQESIEHTATISQPSPSIPGPTERPARHRHSLLTCLLGVEILMRSRCCLRGGKVLLQILQQHLKVGTPSHETLRRWLLRIGLYVLRQPLEAAKDLVWIVDHSCPMGPEKCLLVVAVPQSVARAKNWALTHQDMRVLHLDVMSSSTGELMEQQLLGLAGRFGAPQQIITDHGTDLRKGIRLLRQAYPEIIDTYDISHKLACLLKAELSNDERWQAFLTACAKARPRLQQTQGSHLMPPEVRVKARYMNLNRQVSWAQETLNYLDSPDDPKLAKSLGLTAEQSRLWVAERIGWVRDFRDDMALYGAMMLVIQVAQTVIEQDGLRRDSVQRFSLALPSDLPNHPRLQRIIDQVNQFVQEEGAKLPDDEGYLGSSDIIESLFGKHKLFTENSTSKGVGPNILLLPLLTVNWTATLVRNALEATTGADVNHWLKTTFGKPIPVRTTPIRTRENRRESKKRHEKLTPSIVPV
jgi:hypothetical protein